MFTSSPFLLLLLSFLLSYSISYPYIQSLFIQFIFLPCSFPSDLHLYFTVFVLVSIFSFLHVLRPNTVTSKPRQPGSVYASIFFILCKFSVISSYLVASINIYSLMQEKIKIKRRQCCGVKCDERQKKTIVGK